MPTLWGIWLQLDIEPFGFSRLGSRCDALNNCGSLPKNYVSHKYKFSELIKIVGSGEFSYLFGQYIKKGTSKIIELI